jgi:hypothetical protein
LKKNKCWFSKWFNLKLILDIDECADPTTNDCDPEEGQCADTTGSYTCSCIAGYTGDGFLCSGDFFHVQYLKSLVGFLITMFL